VSLDVTACVPVCSLLERFKGLEHFKLQSWPRKQIAYGKTWGGED